MTTSTDNFRLAVQYHRANRLECAEKVYRQLLAETPEQPEVLYGLGILEKQKGEIEEAEKMFQAALRIDPRSFKTWFSLGNLRQERSQWSAAVEAYYQALSIQPQEAAIQNNLGQALEHLGQWEAAIACYQEAIALKPSCTEAATNLSQLLLAQGYINTFDIFDTLIARFCIDAEDIFHQVERTTGVAGFAQQRQQAENMLFVSSAQYTLDDIYQELAKNLSLGFDQTQTLRATEIEVEVQNAIGIEENLSKVAAGDLLISDTYLPEAVLRRMLKKVGLYKPVRLLISAKGKRSGQGWQEIVQVYKIALHIGDDPHSDLRMASTYGVKANLYQGAQLSTVETSLQEIGAEQLCKIIRKVRLNNHFKTAEEQDFYTCFIQGNLVLLTLFSIYLLRQTEQQNIDQYLFSSRDCYHLHTLFKTIAKQADCAVKQEYLYTSRIARVKGSQSYLNYLSNRFNQAENSAIVDLVGTGFSLSYLLEKLNRELNTQFSPHLVFLHKTQLNRVNQLYEGIELLPKTLSFIPDIPQNLNIDALEVLNYIQQPMLKDVQTQDIQTQDVQKDIQTQNVQTQDVQTQNVQNQNHTKDTLKSNKTYQPIFLPNQTPEDILSFISSTERIVQDFSHEITPSLIEELRYQIELKALSQLAIALYSQLCQHSVLLSYFMPFHAEENRQIEQQLSSLLASQSNR